MANGLLINYEYCTGCHSCEVACKKEHDIALGKWGIKLTEVGPFQIDSDNWEWNYLPFPTQLCDLCTDRVAQGKDPSCVHHCLAFCLEYGSLEELCRRAEELGGKTSIFVP